MAAPNPRRQRAARQKLAELLTYPETVFTIHYACERFDANDGLGSPRVTAIALRNIGTGETHTFSIHAEAERARLAPVQILSRLDALEGEMLGRFFAFLDRHQAMRFVHWNMRDVTYGFEAIEHRFTLLGGHPVRIPGHQRFDLARLLIDIYGTGFVGSPPLETLAGLNDLGLAGLLMGRAEADAFHRGDYAGVQRSAVGKTRLLNDILMLAHDRTLRTEAGFWTLNIGRLREAVELFHDNPIKAAAGVAFAALTAVVFIYRYIAT
jgi:hypothetical protein